MAKLVKIFSIIVLIVTLSNCEGLLQDSETAQEIDTFPTTYPGLLHDLVFTTGEQILRISKEDNSITPLILPGIEYIPHHLRIGTSGKYLYFVDRTAMANSVGHVYQYDLEMKNLKRLSVEPLRSMILINDDFFYSRSLSPECSVSELFWLDELYRISDGKRMDFCEVYAQFASVNDTPKSGFSTLFMYNNGLYTSYFHNFVQIENENVRFDYKVSFAVIGDQLIVTEFEQLTEKHEGILSQNGTYRLNILDNQGLWIENLTTGETTLIDESLKSLSNIDFVVNETHVMIRKEREYSREYFRKYGFHLYEISSGRYFQILEQSQDMRMVRFSENGDQIVAVAQFVNNRRWHIVVLSYDQQKISIVSNPSFDNSFPKFIY
jgi:hypothetical protein